MTDPRTRKPATYCVLALSFVLLLWASLLLPQEASLAPPAQNETLNLGPGADVTVDVAITYQGYDYQVNVPPGADLTVWVGTDQAGQCWWRIELYNNGVDAGTGWAGSAPNTWSDPLQATIGSGSAQVKVSEDTSCMAGGSGVARVRFKVGGTPQPDTPTPTPQIEFWADQYQIRRGECTTLHWRAQNIREIYFEGQGVGGAGDQQACPQQTTTYTLRVVTSSGEVTRQVTIVAEEPTPTPIPPTWTPIPPT